MIATVVIIGLLGASWAVFLGLGRVSDALRQIRETMTLPDISNRVRVLEDQVDRLPHKWAEMVDMANRSEGRTRAIVKRARKEFADLGFEHASLDAEAANLRLVDGEGSEDSELQPVRRSLAAPVVTSPGPEADWKEMTRRKKYGA